MAAGVSRGRARVWATGLGWGVFEVTIRRTFNAIHALRFADGSAEPPHGHDWRVAVTVARPALDENGLVADFHELERQLDAALNPWHGRDLNALPPFDQGRSPTAEHVALTVAEALALPAGVWLRRVEVEEAPGCVAAYLPEGGAGSPGSPGARRS